MPNPKTTRFATFYNDKRCKINADVFKNYLKTYHSECSKTNICTSAIIIKATAEWGKCKKVLTFGQRKILFEECPESMITNSIKTRCNVMQNANDDVEQGIANGTSYCSVSKSTFEKKRKLQQTMWNTCN